MGGATHPPEDRGPAAGPGAGCKGATTTELTVEVPKGVQPGRTKLAVSVPAGGELHVTVPAEALAGDKLVLTQQEDSSWACVVTRPKRRPLPSPVQPAGGSDESVSFLVPAGTTPGVTQLSISAGNGEKIQLPVPEHAVPGDKVVLTRAKGAAEGAPPEEGAGWKCTLHRDKLASGTADSGLEPFAQLPELRGPAPDAEVACQAMFNAARDAGCVVSKKLMRGCAPPLNIQGIVAAADIEEGEELMFIPDRFHITPKTVQTYAPALWEATQGIHDLPASRRCEVAQAAFVGQLLCQAEDRCAAEKDPERGGGPEVPADAAVQRVWDGYCDFLLSEDFGYHPYRIAAADPAGMKAALEPSPEADFFLDMAQDLISVHKLLLDGAPPELQRRLPDLGMFLRAKLSMVSRVFQARYDSTLVPVCDLFNHAPNQQQGVSWRWDEGREAMVVTADRAHLKGEEVFCSYGPRSNLLLYRTYGFTLPVRCEPAWSFIVRPPRVRAIYEAFLPGLEPQPQLMLDSKHMDETVCEALNKVTQNGRDASAFLRLCCARSMWAYEHAPGLQTALGALRRCREKSPGSHAWWEHLAEEDAQLADEDATRVRMCEYLCLTGWLEALDFAEGNVEESQCLQGAEQIRKLLVQAIEMLRKGRCFALKKEWIEQPAEMD